MRPKVRTTSLSPTEVDAVRRRFGTFTNAWRAIGPRSGLDPRAFHDAVAGRPVRPSDLAAVRAALAK